jgi:dTDP-4-amino-4,6-dideoxygalactose transaminase
MGKRYWHFDFDDIGMNHRMTDAQAAVGLVQLRRLDHLNSRRIELANQYCEKLCSLRGITLPCIPSDRESVFHSFCIQIEPSFPLSKEDFMWAMWTQKRIRVWSHYMPVHLTTAYRNLSHKEGECPVAEAAFDKYVSLPIHPRLSTEAVEYLTQSIRELAV